MTKRDFLEMLHVILLFVLTIQYTLMLLLK